MGKSAVTRDVRVAGEGRQLVVEWGDGHVSTYSLEQMRAGCGCPVCRPAGLVGLMATSRSVRVARYALLASAFVMVVGLLLLAADAETVVVSGPALGLVAVWMFWSGWRSGYRWVPWAAGAHVGLIFFLIVLVNANNWGPRSAWVQFLAVCVPYVAGMLGATWWMYRNPPAAGEPPSWNCRACGYLLLGLSEDRCPECGTGFDRADLPARPPAGVESAPA